MKRFGSLVLCNVLLISFIPGCSHQPLPMSTIKVATKKYAIEPAVIKVKSGIPRAVRHAMRPYHDDMQPELRMK